MKRMSDRLSLANRACGSLSVNRPLVRLYQGKSYAVEMRSEDSTHVWLRGPLREQGTKMVLHDLFLVQVPLLLWRVLNMRRR